MQHVQISEMTRETTAVSQNKAENEFYTKVYTYTHLLHTRFYEYWKNNIVNFILP